MSSRWGVLALGIGLVGVTGCEQDQVVLKGTVYTSSDPESPPLADASLRFVDFDGEVLGRATADELGAFSAELPGGISLFVEVSAEGYATSTFPGVLGLAPEQEVEHRVLFGTPLAVVDAWRARFAGCPGADDPDRAMVIGEIRVYGITDPLTGGRPSTSVGQATVHVRGEPIEACYLDEEGAAWDPEAEYTGVTGMFAVFGVPPGVQDLEISADFAADIDNTEVYPVWVPAAETVVSPWYPAYVQLL